MEGRDRRGGERGSVRIVFRQFPEDRVRAWDSQIEGLAVQCQHSVLRTSVVSTSWLTDWLLPRNLTPGLLAGPGKDLSLIIIYLPSTYTLLYVVQWRLHHTFTYILQNIITITCTIRSYLLTTPFFVIWSPFHWDVNMSSHVCLYWRYHVSRSRLAPAWVWIDYWLTNQNPVWFSREDVQSPYKVSVSGDKCYQVQWRILLASIYNLNDISILCLI